MKLLASAFFGAILMVVGLTAETANAEPAGYYQDQKVVYHNDRGSTDNAAL